MDLRTAYMNILLTNDDGIDAEGINSLYDVFSKDHNVYIIAPAGEQSGCSNAISIMKEIKVKRISENKFTADAYPADCVMLGLHGEIIPEVDLIVSGINHGPNLGDDLFFSGTVAGARTAYIFGKAGIAISMNSFDQDSEYLHNAAVFLSEYIDKNREEILGKPLFLNINYPDYPVHEIKGEKYTFIGKRNYMDSYIKSDLGNKEMTMKMNGFVDSVNKEGSDATELLNGYISITPIRLNCTDFLYLRELGIDIN